MNIEHEIFIISYPAVWDQGRDVHSIPFSEESMGPAVRGVGF